MSSLQHDSHEEGRAGRQEEASGPIPGGMSAIVVAAGTSQRMGTDKLWLPLGGRPLLAWPIATLASSALVDTLVVVTHRRSIGATGDLLARLGISGKIVEGGSRRQDSVCAGLEAVGDAEWVIVHDGARPFLSHRLISDGVRAARETGAAIAAVPVVDTIKQVVDGHVIQSLDRSTLWAAQTPQIFRTELLARAHATAQDTVTDDAALIEALGIEVRVYEGEVTNLKVTNWLDLQVAEAIAARHAQSGGVTGAAERGRRSAASMAH